MVQGMIEGTVEGMVMTQHEPVRALSDEARARPLCPNCGRAMQLARTTPQAGELPELHSYKCGECGVWTNEAAETAD